MIKLAFTIITILLSQSAYSEKYTGCTDSSYIAYVEKRLSFYEKLDKERYQKAQKDLAIVPLNEREYYLFNNTVLSAQFDTDEIALRNIKAYERHKPSFIKRLLMMFMPKGDSIHRINIAKGWLALKSGNEDEAIRYLMASTNNKGSPVLGSFGPDMTLIRELYKRGNKSAVLQYLKQAQLFWHTESANEYIDVWRKMIKNNCPIQFQFYDTTSIVKLGLD